MKVKVKVKVRERGLLMFVIVLGCFVAGVGPHAAAEEKVDAQRCARICQLAPDSETCRRCQAQLDRMVSDHNKSFSCSE